MTEQKLYPSINDMMNIKMIPVCAGNYCKMAGCELIISILSENRQTLFHF
jgi:hypothetical protein